MKHLETQWKSRDGLTILGQGWEPDAQPPKAIVCLVHGLGEHSARYAHVAEAFVREGYALFAADTRGHGRSEGPRGHIPSIEAVMQDIDGLLEQARTSYPELPLFLYGHSLGGILVLHYGLKRKPAVQGAIVTSPALHTALEQQPAKVMAAKVLGTFLPGVSLPSGLDPTQISRDASVVQAYTSDPLVHDKVTLGFGKIMIGVNQWTLEHAREFPLPLLLLHGQSDAIAFATSSTEFAASMGDKCSLSVYEGAFHELHNEPEKKEVFRTMTDWLDTQLGK
ncbi:alpha/beta hydrolase [Telluribacter sp.]|jgi:alpha-beta hydrolase superfamily lysophospholipase|uniref:alpha/beta hydrolase n=1 Tax=Telluribacter sp. TaxID=1978767 RepID=UPI002E13F170|nr:alpha/beta hydrolase [Telluribacter sp.]